MRVPVALRAIAALAAPLLAGAASPPTAELQYLMHSGWLVKTARHVLVFDYVERYGRRTT